MILFLMFFLLDCFPDKVFSFLSQDEVEKMKQEEGNALFHLNAYSGRLWTFVLQLGILKIAHSISISISERKIATLTRDELKSWAQIDENEGMEEIEDMMEEQDNRRPK